MIGASHPAGVAADWLTSAWGQNGGFADPTPAAAAVEEVAAGWVLDLLGLPAEAGVGFCTGATMANFTALAAARGELLRAGRLGRGGARAVRGAGGAGGAGRRGAFLGLPGAAAARLRGRAGACGGGGRRGADAAGGAGARCWRGSTGPMVVCLQAGNVVSGAFDPFAELIPLARAKGAWVHVDGAFGLWALRGAGARRG